MPFFRARFPGPSHSSLLPNPPHQFSLLAQTTLQKGHSQKLIRAEREGEEGRFAKPFGPKKHPLGGWEAVGGLVIKKRETPSRFPCQCKDTTFACYFQMWCENY